MPRRFPLREEGEKEAVRQRSRETRRGHTDTIMCFPPDDIRTFTKKNMICLHSDLDITVSGSFKSKELLIFSIEER